MNEMGGCCVPTVSIIRDNWHQIQLGEELICNVHTSYTLDLSSILYMYFESGCQISKVLYIHIQIKYLEPTNEQQSVTPFF